jgi:hypothetical protein
MSLSLDSVTFAQLSSGGFTPIPLVTTSSASTFGTVSVASTMADQTPAPEAGYHFAIGVPVVAHATVKPSAWPQWTPSLLSTATADGAIIIAALIIAPVTAFYVLRDRHRWPRQRAPSPSGV